MFGERKTFFRLISAAFAVAVLLFGVSAHAAAVPHTVQTLTNTASASETKANDGRIQVAVGRALRQQTLRRSQPRFIRSLKRSKPKSTAFKAPRMEHKNLQRDSLLNKRRLRITPVSHLKLERQPLGRASLKNARRLSQKALDYPEFEPERFALEHRKLRRPSLASGRAALKPFSF